MAKPDLLIAVAEREHLRELARRYKAAAELPVMQERAKLWYAHNGLRAERPVVAFDTGPINGELMPPLRTASSFAQEIERQLLTELANFELVNDDRVIPGYVRIPWRIHLREFDMDMHVERAADEKGRQLGYAIEHPITDLERDLPKLKHSTFGVDLAGTVERKQAAEEILGDILPVRIENHSLRWYVTPSQKVVNLMGMEAMLMAMIDQPDAFNALYQFLADDILAFVQWQEREGLLTANNGNHYAGAGSYGFSDELTPPAEGGAKLKDLWANMNSQETVGISPGMYREFIYPWYEKLAEPFGLVYYGCCEPVHDIWESCLCNLPHMRKVSISAWCNEEAMGERLRRAPVIYSRKPRPNYIGVGTLDEAAFAQHITQTLSAARGCHLEIIFRDVYTLEGDRTKAGRAIRLVRELIDRLW